MTRQPTTELHCAQCGGLLNPEDGQQFLACPYCGSAVYVDKSQVVFHWSVACTVTPEAAGANLRRWMAGNHTVKDLDRKARIASTQFQYFPLWYVRARDRQSGGQEKVFVEPAAATSITEIKSLDIPAGDLKRYDSSLDSQAVEPTVPFPVMVDWLGPRGIEPEEIAEAAIVHLPVYVFKYSFGGRTYTAMVEGASGKVFANLFPQKAEIPYYLVAAAAIGGFLCISTFPLAGYVVGDVGGLAAGLLATLCVGALYALPIFAFAAWVSAKV